MPIMREAKQGVGRFKVMFTLTGCVATVSVIALVVHLKSDTLSQQPLACVQENSPSAHQTDAHEMAAIPEIPLGRLLGINNPAPPPIFMYVGRQPGQADTPDLSTPAVAVQTALSLIDQGAMDKLALCFNEDPNNLASILYPHYVGQPIGLVEVSQDGDFAEVIWEATVHTEFSQHGRHWSPDDVITLSARLIRVEGLWKVLQLYEGEKDGDPQDNVSAH